MDSEEFAALEAIFCAPGEFEMTRDDGTGTVKTLALNLPCEQGLDSSEKFPVGVTFTLDSSYPNKTPRLSISSTCISRTSSNRIIHDLTNYAESLLGEPMLLDMALWVQQNAKDYATKLPSERDSDAKSLEDASGCVSDSVYTCLLALDHMRAKAKYVKTIVKWTEKLGLAGRLIFQGKLILILLQGCGDSIKEYIHLQRTVSVDVDSKGRSCKERMMSVLAEEPVGEIRLDDFQVVEVSERKKVEEIFMNAGLCTMYKQYVIPLQSR